MYFKRQISNNMVVFILEIPVLISVLKSYYSTILAVYKRKITRSQSIIQRKFWQNSVFIPHNSGTGGDSTYKHPSANCLIANDWTFYLGSQMRYCCPCPSATFYIILSPKWYNRLRKEITEAQMKMKKQSQRDSSVGHLPHKPDDLSSMPRTHIKFQMLWCSPLIPALLWWHGKLTGEWSEAHRSADPEYVPA